MPAQSIFQSTLPARGATWQTCSATGFQIFQSTLPARGATVLEQTREIKVTAFQSTLPARGATCRALDVYGRRGAISIHAPRTGSDMRREIARLSDEDFNPRSPHGERRRRCFNRPGKSIFQSTLPARGATLASAWRNRQCNFNPRSPHGERQSLSLIQPSTWHISIHAPRTGSDSNAQEVLHVHNHFNPRSPHGERLRRYIGGKFYALISIHAPRTGSDDSGIQNMVYHI